MTRCAERSLFVPSHIVFEVTKCLLVVLNGLLFGWFGKSERCLAACVADGAIGELPGSPNSVATLLISIHFSGQRFADSEPIVS